MTDSATKYPQLDYFVFELPIRNIQSTSLQNKYVLTWKTKINALFNILIKS